MKAIILILVLVLPGCAPKAELKKDSDAEERDRRSNPYSTHLKA